LALSLQAGHESTRELPRHCADGAVVSQPKNEMVPAAGYMNASLAQQDIGRFLMQRYNWKRPHQFNGRLPSVVAEEKLDAVSGLS
jgi:transposase InsO family protein